MFRLLYSALALRLSGHDAVHCHCRHHYMPPRHIRLFQLLSRVFVWATIAVAGGWVAYEFLDWAVKVPGAMRINVPS